MEDYEKFVQHLIPSLRINETDETRKHSAASSVIRFYGQPILPPLLSGARMEEMQQYRDAALNAADNRKLKFESKMAHVQNILASVQVRRTPTLEEVLRESETPRNVTFPHKGSDGSASHSICFSRSKDDLLLSKLPCSSQNNGASVCPLTSTEYSAFLSSDVTPQQHNCNRSLTSQQESQPPFISCMSHHQSASSGYLTCENVENTTSVSTGKETLAFGSSGGACDLRNGFFILSTSNTIAKMPDIISHPPIDGEELEKSVSESPCCQDFLDVKDISCCSQQHDSITCERKHDRSTDGEDYHSVSELIDLDKGNSLDVNSLLSNSPESSNAQSVCCHSSPESSVQHKLTEPAEDQGGEGEPSVHPHRLSLQALLRRSQECRRRQRMLRNQAKNAKVQERTQAEGRTRTEELSLSDKENNEVLPKSSETSEGKRPKENRGSEKTLPKAPRDNQRKIAPKFFWEKTNLNLESTQSGRDESSIGILETTFESSQLSFPLDVETKATSTSTQKKSLLPACSPVQRALHLINSPTGVYRRGKYNTIPVPSVSRSPVWFRNTFPAETARTQVAFLTSDHKAGEVDVVHVTPPSVQRVLANSSLHIDQLEFNLSGLKAMISDLESTLAENLGQQNQSELAIKGSGHSAEVDPPGHQPVEKHADYQKDEAGSRPRIGCSSSVLGRFATELSRASLGDSVAVSDVIDTDSQLSAEAVDVSELRLVKNIAARRAKEKVTHIINNKGQTDAGSQGQQPTARSLLGETQRLQIPQLVSVLPSEGGGTRHLFPSPSDGGDPPAEGRSKSTAGGYIGLNQSYEVESPSDLWLHEVSAGSDRGLESSLTPESGGEVQGGGSKVKRRLLMHMTEETTKGSDGKVNSSCSDGASQRQGAPGRRDKQETLMQADAAQIRELRAEHRRQQEELLQASFQLSERYRPLLLAAVKGFLTRRLLRSERVAQLVRTVRDTQELLQTLNPVNRQDVLLQERVVLQLRAARYEVYDIFFGLSTSERMQLIGWDREAAREKELRRQSGQPRRNSSLSAATQKSLERRKERMLQRKAAGRHRGAVARSDRGAGSSAQQPQQTKGGRLKADPLRVPKSTYSSRPR